MAKRRKPSFRESLKKKQVEPGKEAKLEKGDLLALLIAAGSIILPALLIVFALIALFIFAWNGFFG